MTGTCEHPPARPVRVALTGAAGQFARTFLAHVRSMPSIRPTVLVDLDPDAVRRLLDDLEWPASASICAGPDEVVAAERSGTVAVVTGGLADAGPAFDVLVEATGDVRHGFATVRACISAGKSVVVASKEVESVAGPWLSACAARRGVGYACAAGDQPANLMDLVAWARGTGMDIVAIGKAGEYDIVHDPKTSTATYRGQHLRIPASERLCDARADPGTVLSARARAFESVNRRTAADLCEMGIVATRLGMDADVESLHYPICTVDELADVYAEQGDGGIIRRAPSVDVFTQMRAPREASIAGGVFVVVRNHDVRTGEILAGKGHVVSRSRRYVCVFRPYHLMGLETAASVLSVAGCRQVLPPSPASGGLQGRVQQDRGVVMAARAAGVLSVGKRFIVRGHHHEIDGLDPVLVPAETGVAPYYLLDGTTLRREVASTDLIGIEDIDGADPDLVAAQGQHEMAGRWAGSVTTSQ